MRNTGGENFKRPEEAGRVPGKLFLFLKRRTLVITQLEDIRSAGSRQEDDGIIKQAMCVHACTN